MQAIALAACYRSEWPLLVIVPASLRLVWAEEFEKWLPGLRPSQVTIGPAGYCVIADDVTGAWCRRLVRAEECQKLLPGLRPSQVPVWREWAPYNFQMTFG